MATPDPLIDQLLAPLARSGLSRLALEALRAVEDLPQRDLGSADARLGAVEEQLEVVVDAALKPLKLERDALQQLPAMAEALGIKGGVSVEIADVDGIHRVESLTDGRRLEALNGYIEAFGEALQTSRAAAAAREQPGS